MLPPILRADSFGKRFGKREILKAATLYAYPGRITVLLGRNGCGKSTLIKLIIGIVRADFGTVHFNQHTYQRPRLHQLARQGLFYIPERGLLSRFLTLEQHLAIARGQKSTADVQRTIEELSLAGLLGNFRNQLSGGERRRADFALAALKQPLCLLADEPFQGISPLDSDVLGHELLKLRDQGAAVVITGHELPPLFAVADEIVWLTAGTTVSLGTVADAKSHHQFKQEYLGAGSRT
jgi:lipopolysaccharide export system ATP-binding protein